MTARPVVTGIGITAPTGLSTEEHWRATLAGRSAIGRVRRFDPTPYPAQLAGEVSGFVPSDCIPARLVPQTDHMTRLALVAAEQALADADAKPDELPEFGMGVMTAASAGGFEFGQNELRKLWSKGSSHVSAYQSFAWFYAVNTGQISIRHGMRGPSGVLVSDQAGGLDAMAQARRQLRSGIKLIVSGGVDGSICSWGWVGQLASRRLSTRREPDQAYLPFDARASGHVPGEGGALLIMEDPESARERSAPAPYGQVSGYAATFDPKPGSGREPGLRRAITGALDDAEVDPGEVDVVYADAAGIADLDRAEAAAIGAVFGGGGVPVTVPKTMTGRLCAGAASLDVATALLSIRDQVIPPAINVLPSPEYELDLVTDRPRGADLRTALVLARGYGGHNSALVVQAADGRPRSGRTDVPSLLSSGGSETDNAQHSDRGPDGPALIPGGCQAVRLV
jgi:act minimal PKS chain-length factor (CLF/KS beta)